MRVSVARPEELASAELARWREIQQASPELENPFLCPEFTLALARVRSDVYCGLVEDGGRIVGLFPFQRSRFGVGRAVGLGLSDCQGFVISEGVEVNAQWMIRKCGLAVWEYDRLLASPRALATPSRTRWRSLTIDLANGFEHYLGNREQARGKLISDTRRKLRKLERDVGTVTFAYDPERGAIQHVIRAKSAQYRRTGLSDRFAEPWILRLVETLHELRTAEFALIVPTLTAGGSWVAGNIMLRYRGTLSGWFPAYNPAHAKYSPGMLHRLKCLEAAASSGVRRVELGREGQPHKERWATSETILLEGAVEQLTLTALIRRAQREPVRILRTAFVKHPRLYRTARRALGVVPSSVVPSGSPWRLGVSKPPSPRRTRNEAAR